MLLKKRLTQRRGGAADEKLESAMISRRDAENAEKQRMIHSRSDSLPCKAGEG